MIFTYMSGVLSTLEKVFGMRSEYSAYVMSGNELSQFLLILSLPCITKIERRPLWVGLGKNVYINQNIVRMQFLISRNRGLIYTCRNAGVSWWMPINKVSSIFVRKNLIYCPKVCPFFFLAGNIVCL